MKTISYSKNIALAAVAGICATSFAISAHADESNTPVPARTVHYSDLNLNTQAGVDVLYNRIRSAAKQVCGGVDSRQWAELAAAKTCMNQAVTASVRAVNNQRLTSTYNEHFGVAPAAANVAALR
jgi:UrcA family protein